MFNFFRKDLIIGVEGAKDVTFDLLVYCTALFPSVQFMSLKCVVYFFMSFTTRLD